MPYALGIDLGSGATTAAISRNDHERWSEPEVVPLDEDATSIASVLHLTDEGTIDVGARALRHVPTRSDHITRGLVDRIGDEIPITLGGRPYPAEVLAAALVGWVVDLVEASEGVPASQVVVTHPAGWGAHRRAVMLGALREVNLPELTLLPRPVAAAESYAAGERIEVGEEIAVYSLGAGRFESAVLRRGSFGFELRAHADSMATLGGDLFDDLLAEHVLAELGGEVDAVAQAQLRAACVTAKERLSTELAVTVPAPRGSKRGTVMVNRTDLEQLVRPAVEATVRSLQRTIQATGTAAGSLRAVVLVGGCGRIPLVAELVSAAVRVRVAAAADPETAVARGAALAAARVAKPTVKAAGLTVKPEPMPRSAVTHTDLMRFDDLPAEEIADIGPPPPRPPVDIAPLEPPRRRLLKLGSRTRAAEDPDDDFDLDRPRDDLDLDERPRRRSSRRDEDPDERRRPDPPFDPARRRDEIEVDLKPTRRRPRDNDQDDGAFDDGPTPGRPNGSESRHQPADGAFSENLRRRPDDGAVDQSLFGRQPDDSDGPSRHQPDDSGSLPRRGDSPSRRRPNGSESHPRHQPADSTFDDSAFDDSLAPRRPDASESRRRADSDGPAGHPDDSGFNQAVSHRWPDDSDDLPRRTDDSAFNQAVSRRRPDEDEVPRRHRTDDSGFNQSLSPRRRAPVDGDLPHDRRDAR
ncbi:Hsp70 family protein [Actinophytocola sp.]|uniref:Hsp70 family protein n=1 Tax=Actinophytocola sp. TaxID=1872138 RepID=UPI002EDABA93